MMSRHTVVSLGAAVILAAATIPGAPACAQLVNPFGRDVVGLSEDEAGQIKSAVRQVLAQYADGARADWQSADGKRAGSVSITRIYTSDGRRCATVQHAFTKGPGYPFHAPLCEVTQGEWRIAF